MRAKRVPAQKQYELIKECRSSGMSDSQWCTQHNINSGTFYNWVSKLRKKGCYDIPESIANHVNSETSSKQDEKKVENMPENDVIKVLDSVKKLNQSKKQDSSSVKVVLENNKLTLYMDSNIEPVLAEHLLRALR